MVGTQIIAAENAFEELAEARRISLEQFGGKFR